MANIELETVIEKSGDVHFIVRFQNHAQQFCISGEALADLEESRKYDDRGLLAFFHRHIDRIIQVAGQKYGQPSSGTILLRTADFSF